MLTSTIALLLSSCCSQLFGDDTQLGGEALELITTHLDGSALQRAQLPRSLLCCQRQLTAPAARRLFGDNTPLKRLPAGLRVRLGWPDQPQQPREEPQQQPQAPWCMPLLFRELASPAGRLMATNQGLHARSAPQRARQAIDCAV